MNQLLPIRDRLRRAGEHLEEIRASLRDYYRSQTYDISGEFDPEAGEIRYHFGDVYDPIPLRLSTVAGEVFHNLRSSLDHLAWDLVETHKPGNAGQHTYFPILKSRPPMSSGGVSPPPKVEGGVSPIASALIERVQPYQLGAEFAADPLYILRELNNIDKHRHVTTRGVRSEGTYLAGPLPFFHFEAALLNVSEYGAEIEFVPEDASVDVQFRTTFQIVVHEVGPGIVVPLIDALQVTSEAVVAIINEAQRTCFPPKQIPFPS